MAVTAPSTNEPEPRDDQWFNAVNNDLTDLDGRTPTDGWTQYTPTWTSSGTNPSLGNGTIIGRYRQLPKTLLITVRLTMGSTTTYGTGSYFVGFPSGIAPKLVANLDQILTAWYFDSSAVSFVYGMALVDGDAGDSLFRMRDGGLVTATSPFTWGTGDRLVFSGTLEIA